MARFQKRSCGRCGTEFARNEAAPGDLCPACLQGPIRIPYKSREEQIASMNQDADAAPHPVRDTAIALPGFVPVLLYLCAVLSVFGAFAGLALPESGGNILIFGFGLMLAGGCWITAEASRLLLPAEEK